MIKFDKGILYQGLSNLRLDSAFQLGKIWFGRLGNHHIVSLRLPAELGELGTYVKSSGQMVDMYDTTGTSKSVRPSSFIELERFIELIQRDGFGDILWNEYEDYAFITIYLADPVLIADFSQPSITNIVQG
jgi:hypothetical protein